MGSSALNSQNGKSPCTVSEEKKNEWKEWVDGWMDERMDAWRDGPGGRQVDGEIIEI